MAAATDCTGVAAGLHALIGLPATSPGEAELVDRAAAHGLAVAR